MAPFTAKEIFNLAYTSPLFAYFLEESKVFSNLLFYNTSADFAQKMFSPVNKI